MKKDITWFIAQTNAEIIEIDAKIAQAFKDIETLNAQRLELVKVVDKLGTPDAVPAPP